LKIENNNSNNNYILINIQKQQQKKKKKKMKFNNILKSVTLALSIPFVFADQKEMTGDCKEIVDFFTEKNVLSSIPKCEVDNNGNVVSMLVL